MANHADLKAAGISLSQLGLPMPGGKEFTTKKQATRHHWSSLIVFIGPVPTLLAVVLVAKYFNVRSTPVVLSLMVAGLIFLWWLSINVWLRLFASRFVNAIRPTGRCPSCLCDLTRCPIEPDDCRVCPECGSAWKVTLAKPRLAW